MPKAGRAITGDVAGARIPHVVGLSSWDRILLQEDLPKGWRIVSDRYPGEGQSDPSDELDIALGYDGGWWNQPEVNDQRRAELAEDWRKGRWKYIQHEET